MHNSLDTRQAGTARPKLDVDGDHQVVNYGCTSATAKTGKTLADFGNHADICHVDMSAHTLPHKPCF